MVRPLCAHFTSNRLSVLRFTQIRRKWKHVGAFPFYGNFKLKLHGLKESGNGQWNRFVEPPHSALTNCGTSNRGVLLCPNTEKSFPTQQVHERDGLQDLKWETLETLEDTQGSPLYTRYAMTYQMETCGTILKQAEKVELGEAMILNLYTERI